MDEKYPAILHLQAGGRVPIATLCMRMIIMVLVYCGHGNLQSVEYEFIDKSKTNIPLC